MGNDSKNLWVFMFDCWACSFERRGRIDRREGNRTCSLLGAAEGNACLGDV
jgi:hypothetical protein